MEITYCPNCGHQNQPGSRFCEECGCDLIQAAAQQEAQMAQQMQQQKQVQAQQEAQAQQRVQAAKQNMAAQTSFNKPQKPQKQKKSHLGLILGITIPVILIGIAVILILTGVIKLPFMDSQDSISNTFTIVPDALGKDEAAQENNLVAMLDGYVTKGGHHLNVNVLNRDTLLDAQKHPELYPQLTIRVSGYAVNFIKLTKEQQDEVIARTFHERM